MKRRPRQGKKPASSKKAGKKKSRNKKPRLKPESIEKLRHFHETDPYLNFG